MPDYEEAIAQSMKQPPPPYYQVAMANQMTTNLSANQSMPMRTAGTRVTIPVETNENIAQNGHIPITTTHTTPVYESNTQNTTNEIASTSTSANDSTMK